MFIEKFTKPIGVDKEPEITVADEESEETVVANEKPEETVVANEEPENIVVSEEKLIITDNNFQILEDKDFEKIGRYINSLENYEQCKFLENFIEKGIELDSLAYKNRKNITPAKLIISFYNTNPASKKALLKNLNSVFTDGEKLSIYNIRRICGLFKKNLYLLGALQIPVEEILKQEFEEIIEPTFIINTTIIDTPEDIVDENLTSDTPEKIANEKPVPDISNDIVTENPIPDVPEKRVAENIKLTDYVKYINAAIRGSLKKAIREELLNESDLYQYEVKAEDFTLTNGNDFLTRMDIKNHVKKIQGIRLGFDTDKGTKNLKIRWRNIQSIIDPTTFFNFYLTIVNNSK